MADIQTVAHGEPLWDNKVNNNFAEINAAVEQMGGQVSGLNWSDLSQDGMVMISGDWGLLPVNRNSGYQTAKLGNMTVVWLHPIIQRLNSDFTGSHVGGILQLPGTILPATYQMGGDIDGDREWQYSQVNGISMSGYSENVGTLWKEGSLFGFSALYLAK